MNKVYSRIDWKNLPQRVTPLNEINLNKMDYSLNEIDNRVVEMDTTKLSKDEANNLIESWSMNESTGVITIRKRSGEQIIFDLNIEKIPVNFSMDENGVITMITSDGSRFTANITDMIPILTFNNSETIAVTVTGTGKDKQYSFSVKNGSITDDMLRSDFLADIRVESAKAELAAEGAAESEKNSAEWKEKAEGWAVGQKNGIDVAEEDETYHNSAKFYAEMAKTTVNNNGWMRFFINDRGHLMMEVENVNNVEFRLNNGRLEAVFK